MRARAARPLLLMLLRRLVLVLVLVPVLDAEPGVSDDAAAGHAHMGRLLDGYGDGMYKTMRDDALRTEAYRAAIQRLARGKVVLDIGTGQFALLARFAAEAGARYVYAIEGNRAAYDAATALVAKENLTDRVGVLFGYSANVSLVELPPPGGMGAGWPGVELVIHELLGEIAGMEGAAFAIADAHERLLRPPAEDGIDDGAVLAPRVSIPQAARSLIAPTQFPPPEYWNSLPLPAIVSPGATFLKIWRYPANTSLLSAGWQVFENLEFDRPASLRGVKRTALTFEVQPPAANGDTAAADGEEAAEKAQRDKDQSDTGNGENGEEAERPGGLLFAGFACYMEVDLAKPGAIEVDTLRDDTHWAQQLLLFGATTVWAGDLIELNITIDFDRGPFPHYIFAASVRHGGAGPAVGLGEVTLDEHF